MVDIVPCHRGRWYEWEIHLLINRSKSLVIWYNPHDGRSPSMDHRLHSYLYLSEIYLCLIYWITVYLMVNAITYRCWIIVGYPLSYYKPHSHGIALDVIYHKWLSSMFTSLLAIIQPDTCFEQQARPWMLECQKRISHYPIIVGYPLLYPVIYLIINLISHYRIINLLINQVIY